MHYKILITLFVFTAFKLNAQVIKSIGYEGNKKTKTKVLEKLTTIKVGEKLDSVVLEKDITLISRLPVCNTSEYVISTDSDGNYEVIYTIEETNTIIPTVNFWTANNQQFAYQLGVKEFNLLGENKQIGGFYRNNGLHSFSVNYQDPFLFSATTGISITLQNLSSLEPLYFDDESADYQYKNSSIEALVLKRISPNHNINLGVIFFNEQYQYVEGYQATNTLRSLDELKLSFKGGFDYNTLKYYYQYVEGFRSLLNFQHVMPVDESNRKLTIFWNDFLYYKRIHQKGNLATRLRLGISSNNDSPFAPFALDNNLNIRGVGNIIDRGTGVMVLNMEYRHTVIDKKWFSMQTNIFVDAGNWRKTGGELNGLVKISGARLHPGIGLRFIHKKIYNAVLRIDYGFSVINEKQQGLVFGVGQYF